jgi:hypothetical protein
LTAFTVIPRSASAVGVVHDQRVDGTERVQRRVDHPARDVPVAEVRLDRAEVVRRRAQLVDGAPSSEWTRTRNP